MRVLLLIVSRRFAGSERSVTTLAAELQRQGHEVWVATKRGGTFREALQAAGVPICPVTLGNLFTRPRLKAWVRAQGIEVVHGNLTGGVRLAVALSRKLGVACVAHARILRADPAYAAAARAGLLIANSEHTAAFYRERLAIAEADMRVVLNSSSVASDPAAQATKASLRAAVLAELGLPPTARLVTLCGRLSPAKGQDVLLRAAPSILEAFPDTHFLIVGDQLKDAAYGRLLKDLAAVPGLSGHVHFLGYRKDIPRLTRAAEVQVVPSRAEPFGLVVIEAMLLETPVVACASGGIPEILNRPELGYPIPIDNPGALADAVRSLLRDPEAAARQAAEARADAERRFSPEGMTRQVVEVYREAMRKAGRR